MVSNDKKIDTNARESFSRAKKDIYGLMSDRDSHEALIQQILIVQQDLLNKFNDTDLTLAEENKQRITELWEYAENVKGNTTRATTAIKKLTARLEKLEKKTSKGKRELSSRITKLKDLLIKTVSELNSVKSKQLSFIRSVKKVQKTIVSKARKPRNKFGSLNPSLEAVEGIGPRYAKRLRDNGIKTTRALLMQGSTDNGRNQIAKKMGFGISKSKVLEWVNRVDLMRISGIGEEYSDLLEEAGVDTVPELAQRNFDNLNAKLEEINKAKKLVRVEPTQSRIKEWISQAKKLPKMIEH